MPKIDHDTKQKILAAAEHVFHLNGFKGARTTLIAETAGISRTMLHYYFNTKEELFQEVMSNTLGVVFNHLKDSFLQAQSLEKIVENLIETISNLFEEKPGLPSFIVNILNTSSELSLFLPVMAQDNLPKLLDDMLEAGKKQGTIDPEVTGEDLMLTIYGLCAFPYLAAPYIKAKENRSDESMSLFNKHRRARLLKFILKGISV